MHKLRVKATHFGISPVGSYLETYFLCVHPSLVEDVLFEIHEKICGLHSWGRLLTHRALTQRYWWAYMQKYAQMYVHK